MKNKGLFLLSLLLIAIISIAFFPIDNAHKHSYEIWKSETNTFGDTIIIDSSRHFLTSNKCAGCHGYDMQGYANVDADGHDINVVDDWRASMMANSTRDPYYRAKVSQELIHHGQYADIIEDKCTSCHAPMANYQSKFDGEPYFEFSRIFTDSLAMDGVSCGACHQIDPEKSGSAFSGKLTYDTSRVIYGPYTIPFGGPMSEFVGFDPKFSEHIFESELCASCHTLVTSAIDAEGNITDTKFVEQATYHEWLNSTYSTNGTNCQTCHMEYILDPVIISNNFIFLSGRKPYALHRFQGANTHMISMIMEYKDSLGLNLHDSIFVEQIEATTEFLQQKTLDLEIQHLGVENDSLQFEVFLKNKSGHKFPSGYPARRAHIEVIVSTIENDTLFFSGKMSSDYRLTQIEGDFENHHDVIKDENQVQVYELVPGNEFGEFTTILLRAFEPLKDNRLVPLGFSNNHSTYDTVLIAGKAVNDPNFNIEDGQEGSGTDRVYFHVDLNGYQGSVNISCKVKYQSIPPEWVDELFDDEHELIDQFEEMYNNVRPIPVQIAETKIDSLPIGSTSTASNSLTEFSLFPNPILKGQRLYWNTAQKITVNQIRIYHINGKLLFSDKMVHNVVINLEPGTYLVEILHNDKRLINKLIVQ